MLNKLRGIIQGMRRVLDMQRMVKLVERMADEIDKSYPSAMANALTGAQFVEPILADVKGRYVEKYGCTLRYSHNVINDCLKEKYGYLEKETRTYTTNTFDVVTVTEEGRRLTDGIKYFPWGLWRAWWETDSGLIRAVLVVALTLFTSLGAGAIVAMIKLLMKI